MGWGAAHAYYEENSDWLDSVEDAYDTLYPRRTQKQTNPKKWKWGCHLCGKKTTREHALRDHLRDKHGWSPEQIEAEVAMRKKHKRHVDKPVSGEGDG